MQGLIHHFLENSAEHLPEKVAFRQGEVAAKYGGINAQANQLAHWLVGRRVGRGDRVALFMENCLEYIVAYYAGLKIGAIVSPLADGLKPDGLIPLIESLSPKVILVSARLERVLRAAIKGRSYDFTVVVYKSKLKSEAFTVDFVDWEDALASNPSDNLNLQIDPSAPANIIFTSGSAGVPKGVVLTHGNITSNTDSICQYLELTADDVQMVVLPFYYVMGQSLLNTHVAVGGTVVVNNQFAYPATVINDMIEHEVTGFSGVPSTYAYLLHRSPLAASSSKLKKLRYCSQAGGHMARKIKEGVRRVLPKQTQLIVMYGATEASARLSYLPAAHFEEKIDSIGIPIPGVTLKVVGPDGNLLPPGVVGELVASGPNIMLGYWKDPEATDKVLDKDGAYRTGDLAYMDQDGFYFVDGRQDDLIKVGGHRINPLEIENTIMDSESVIETAVLGIKDDRLGNRLIAMVVARQNSSDALPIKQSILRYCADKLPRYKIPSEIVVERTLPKTDSGKIDRWKCRDILKLVLQI